jgi:hypothetical protein
VTAPAPIGGGTPAWYAFAGALFALGLVMFMVPDSAPYLGLALVLGALYAAEGAAEARGIPGPLAELGLTTTKG